MHDLAASDSGPRRPGAGCLVGSGLNKAGRGACRPLVWLTLALSAALAGCEPGAPAPDPQQQQHSRDEALWRDIIQAERMLRAQPREREQVLRRLQSRTTPGSIERLEVLSLRGHLAAMLRDRRLVDEVRRELNPWPVASAQPAATLVAAVTQARFMRDRGDLREARKALGQLLDGDTEALPPTLRIRAFALLANLESDLGQMEAALAAAQMAVQLAEALGQPWRHALTLADLSHIHFRAQQIERSHQIAAEALSAARLDPDPETMNAVLTLVGIVHSEDADLSVSRQAFTDALSYARQSGADSILALSLGNYADQLLRSGQYVQALALSEEALPLARRSQHLNAEIVALHNAGAAKIALKRVEEGKRDVHLAITLDEQQGALASAAEGLLELGEYLERASDWAGAIEAFHRYRKLLDQVLRDDTRKALMDAQERYDAERRAKDIELLERDNSLKSEQIKSRDLEFGLWAALAGCVALSALLLGMAYRRIRRTNEALKTSNESLRQLSERDPLTGLANRRHFQTAIKRLADAGGLSGTIYLIDIDHFKRINDDYGHAAGDSVLTEVARRLRGALRSEDLVVRWGGEEFLIVAPPSQPSDAQHLAQRLLDLVGQPVRHADLSIPVTCSLGFASFPVAPHGLKLGWERAIDLVDTVMYLAKAHGRNKAYGVIEIEARDEAELAALATRLEAAWQAGEVQLVALQGPAQTEAPA